MADNVGKMFEEKVKDALKGLWEECGMFSYRIQDSHSAGRQTGNAPADFLIGYEGVAMLLECKASEKYASMVDAKLSSIMDSGQAAYHQSWNNNGLKSVFLFYSDSIGSVEVYDGKEVATTFQLGGKVSPLHSDSIYNLKHLIRGLFSE